ncbi:MAG: hypothetical protein ABJN26_22645 [Stappiaceae bacterium]|uniref:hypothetical protein n=1 Tax=Roseibium sp. TaxID=1936156 RepID=UPI00329A3616
MIKGHNFNHIKITGFSRREQNMLVTADYSTKYATGQIRIVRSDGMELGLQ